MTLDEAIAFLSGCTRDELQDHAFGDAEIYWLKDGIEVADGYWGPAERAVHIGDHVFRDPEVRRLFGCGTPGTIERNDATGPEEYVAGETMQGLTPEGVLDELTRGNE